jgi:hypothetical protein
MKAMQALTQDSIEKARQWYATNSQKCIDEVKSGLVRVNHPEQYFESCEQHALDALAGKFDHTFGFWQQAYYIQTGECIAFLPNY